MRTVWNITRYTIGPALLALAVVHWPSRSVTIPLTVIAIVWIFGLAVASIRTIHSSPGATAPGPESYSPTIGLADAHHHHHHGGFVGGDMGGHGGHGH